MRMKDLHPLRSLLPRLDASRRAVAKRGIGLGDYNVRLAKTLSALCQLCCGSARLLKVEH